MLSPEVQEIMRDIEFSLPEYGTIMDQETSELSRYDPHRIAPHLQTSLLKFVGQTPRTPSGHKKWLLGLASRQQGKTATAVLAMYIRTAYNEGMYSALIADNKGRAEDMFRHLMTCHDHMEPSVKAETIPNRESRQLTFDHGGKIRTLSAEANMVGIGRSYDNLHMSELPFWQDAAEAWNGIYPAVTNRKEACVIMESTPAPMAKPSAEWFKDMCAEARKGVGRWQFLFAPFFTSVLCERPWDKKSRLTAVEIRLLDRFGPKGEDPVSAPGETRYLTLENISFRRTVLRDDAEIRRHPDLFNIYFPVDPITCWVHAGSSAIPSHALDEHLKRILVPWLPADGMYQEYKTPVPGALYAIGADPAGWMGGDQASFQCLELWADKWGWEQAAVFSSNEVDPVTFARKIIEAAERWNNATVIVENNGVGLASLAILEMATSNDGVVLKDDYGEERRYHLKNLHYNQLAGTAATAKPGIAAGSKTNAAALASLVDALMDKLIIRDEETLDQLRSYRRDKEVQAGNKFEIINPGKTQSGRRSRHHWDRVSALLWCCFLARTMPARFRRRTVEQSVEEVETLNKTLDAAIEKGLTYNQQKAARASIKKLEKGRKSARRKGRVRYKKSTKRP